jgi:hypothetical protein
MTSPKIDILSQGSDLAQLLLHTVPVRGEEASQLERLPDDLTYLSSEVDVDE